MCVALLIASEFMPVSLLTPIAHDLGATEGMAGQAISALRVHQLPQALLVTRDQRLATVAFQLDELRFDEGHAAPNH